MSKPVDPVVVELTAIRLFCEPAIPYEANAEERREIVTAREKEWRADTTAEVRETFRLKASILLALLGEDGVAFRAGRNTETALHNAITVPAHAAYELPKPVAPPDEAPAITPAPEL